MTGPRGLPPSAGYQVYLVRLWQERPGGPWRALAKDSQSGDEVRFATLEQLCLFLHERMAGSGDADTG